MKGQIQTVESIITIGIIAGVFVVFYSGREQLPEFETVNWKLSGFSALQALDRSNQLRQYVLENDTTAIVNKLSPLLPGNLNYNVTLCEEDCLGLDVSASKLTSVTYLITGNIGNFTKRQVVLYIWK